MFSIRNDEEALPIRHPQHQKAFFSERGQAY